MKPRSGDMEQCRARPGDLIQPQNYFENMFRVCIESENTIYILGSTSEPVIVVSVESECELSDRHTLWVMMRRSGDKVSLGRATNVSSRSYDIIGQCPLEVARVVRENSIGSPTSTGQSDT